MTKLLEEAIARRDAGRKSLVPYLMGGIPDPTSYPDALRAVARHADIVEVGLPYSDPLMDGPAIAAAGERALAAGIGPLEAIDLTDGIETGTRVAMTYYNPIHRVGEQAFCERLAAAGFAGLIVPDIPLEESASLQGAAAAADLAWIPLVAPTSPPERVAAIAAGATGFIYAVSTLGVTGTRAGLSERAARVVASCRQASDLPVYVGIGVSNAEQAVEAASSADGVVLGSAVVTRVVEQGAEAAAEFLAGVRAALDGLTAPTRS